MQTHRGGLSLANAIAVGMLPCEILSWMFAPDAYEVAILCIYYLSIDIIMFVITLWLYLSSCDTPFWFVALVWH